MLESIWKNLQNSEKTGVRNPTLHNFHPYIPLVLQNPPSFQAPHVVPKPPRPMEAIFSPMDFIAALQDLPLNYAQIITLYDGEGNL